MNNRLDEGLLLLRLGIGGMFVSHGLPKLLGGPERWAKLGHAMHVFGVDFFPVAWGLAAAVAEGVGGVLLVLGMLFRPATAMMFVTMLVATASHLDRGDGLGGASHAIELAFVFASLFLIGPGAYRFGRR
jgi:putative oxidoreductase